MKKIALKSLVLNAGAIVLLGLASCKSKPELVDFVMNNNNYPSMEDPSAMLIDSSQALRLLVGDTVVLQDVSKPEGSIKSRAWSISINGGSPSKTEGQELIAVPFSDPGLYKIQLCVNGEEYCATKCVLVDALPQIEVDTTPIFEPTPTPSPTPMPRPRRPSGGGSGGGGGDIAVVTPPPAPKPQPPTPEPTKPKDKGLTNTGSVGVPSSSRQANSECADPSQSSFSVKISPKKAVELTSFYVYTDGCGSMKISLQGGGINESTTIALNKGRNDIKIGTALDDPRLEAGKTYVLTCTAAKSGSCSEDRIPRFEDAKDCNFPAKTAPELGLNQDGHLFIYDLKFRF